MIEAYRENGFPAIECVGDTQFSVFELLQGQNELNIRYEDAEGTTQIVDLSTISADALSDILTNASFVELLYSMAGGDFDPLTPLEAPRQLVFALGDQEIEVTIQADGTIRFEDLDKFLNLNPAGYLALRLYQNSDAENILWEYVILARVIAHSLFEDSIEKVEGVQTALRSLDTMPADSDPLESLYELVTPQAAYAGIYLSIHSRGNR